MAQRFTMVEAVNGYAIYDTHSGEERWVGDGVDMFFVPTRSGEFLPLSPGTPEFDDAFIEWLRDDEDEIAEAYDFPITDFD